jgi:hypothetical protein
MTGPANMSNQRLVIVAVGVLLVMGGLFALRFPVFLGHFDQWGFQINCGSGFQSALTQAVIADSAETISLTMPHRPSDASRLDHRAAGDRSAAG